jgi:ABC-type polysaccharide/polyol phosphate transport system ATPase subunit
MLPTSQPQQNTPVQVPDLCSDAVVVSHVTKQFIIRHTGTRSLKRTVLSAMQLKRGVMQPKRLESFTALNDVSFSVPHGQTVAIIGRNGSGKSTLLSLLAQVYKPTSGDVSLYNTQGGRARIAPLLELGAGFHPDLTGLENTSFYGAVLGLTAKQIEEQQDSIVEFAELAEKMDTPMRNWNKGAMLRLGFAIAVHTDPDILLIDEVLAVGDEAFQNKCFRRIEALQEAGKTIVFVTHDLSKIERIASRAIWLNRGVLEMDGDVPTVVQAYRAAAS